MEIRQECPGDFVEAEGPRWRPNQTIIVTDCLSEVQRSQLRRICEDLQLELVECISPDNKKKLIIKK